MSRRTERVGSTILKELSVIILRDLSDPRLIGFPSITRVKVAPDLSTADVYISVMGTDGQQTAALNALRHSAGLLRAKLTKAMDLRIIPYLRFHIDEELKEQLKLMALLDKVAAEKDEMEARLAKSQPVKEEGVPGEMEQGKEAILPEQEDAVNVVKDDKLA